MVLEEVVGSKSVTLSIEVAEKVVGFFFIVGGPWEVLNSDLVILLRNNCGIEYNGKNAILSHQNYLN